MLHVYATEAKNPTDFWAIRGQYGCCIFRRTEEITIRSKITFRGINTRKFICYFRREYNAKVSKKEQKDLKR
jgi:hypothetical protein